MTKLIIDAVGGKRTDGNPLDIKNFVPETFITHVHLFTIDGFKIKHEMFVADGVIKEWLGWYKCDHGCGSRCGSMEVF